MRRVTGSGLFRERDSFEGLPVVTGWSRAALSPQDPPKPLHPS
jgi:hypothetical protein